MCWETGIVLELGSWSLECNMLYHLSWRYWRLFVHCMTCGSIHCWGLRYLLFISGLLECLPYMRAFCTCATPLLPIVPVASLLPLATSWVIS